MILRSFHLVFYGLFIWKTDALVDLTTENDLLGKDSFSCGKSEVLICTIKPFLNNMAITKNTSTDQLASCSVLKCSSNPAFAHKYNFIFNESSGIFEMTIINVTLADQGTAYFCEDGKSSANVTVDVTVHEVFNTTLSEQQIDSNTTVVRASSGCITNTTAENAKFKWWLQEANDTTGEKHYFDESISTEVKNDSVCKADTNCWTDGFTQITSILNLTEVETGKEYNVGINVTFGSDYSDSVPLNKSRTFVLNLPIQEREPSPPTCCTIGIIFAYWVIWIVQLQMCFFGYSQCSYYLAYGLMRWFLRLQLLTHVPVFGIIPAIYIYSTLEKSNRRYITLYNVVASAPLLGIVVKVISSWYKIDWESNRPDCKYIFTFVAMAVVSMVLEIFVILLCTVWCMSQWYYPIIIADLITRWVLFIFLAVLYHANIVPKMCRDSNTNINDVLDSSTSRGNVSDSNTNRENVPSPLVFGIALWCTPIIGIIFNINWKCRGHTGHTVAPDPTGISPRSNRETSQKKDNTPRPLPKIPRVTSRHVLKDNTGFYPKLPQIMQIKTA